jgi:glutathione S-transferase
LAPHIALHEAGLEFALEQVNPNTKRIAGDANYLDVNPNGYVPALEIEPGLVLTEGPAIMQYIADKVPGSRIAAGANSRIAGTLSINVLAEFHHVRDPQGLFTAVQAKHAR